MAPQRSDTQVKRVLHLINSFVHGGAEGFACELAHATQLQGWDCAVCAVGSASYAAEQELRERLDAAGIPAMSLDRRETYAWLSRARQLRAILRSNRIDLVHIHTASPVALSACGVGVARVLTIHAGSILGPYRVARGVVESFLAHTSDRVVSVSEASRESVARRVRLPASAVTVIRNGVDFSRFSAPTVPRAVMRAKLGVGSDDLVAVFVARVDSNKGHETLIQALTYLPPQYSKLQVVCAGRLSAAPAYVAQLRKIASDLALSHRLHFVGQIDDTPSLLGAADIAVSPSYSESFGIAAVEALAAGIPLVASDIPSHREVTDGGRVAWLAAVKDPKALATAMAQALEDATADTRMAGREHAESRFGIDEAARRYIAVYSELLREGPGRRRPGASHQRATKDHACAPAL